MIKDKIFTYQDDDGVDHEVELPGRYIVCQRCQGKGQHCNPSIGAITEEQWHRDWSRDEQEMYLTGGYDVPCHECDGRRVTWNVDVNALKVADQDGHAAYLAFLEGEAEYRAARRSEAILFGEDY